MLWRYLETRESGNGLKSHGIRIVENLFPLCEMRSNGTEIQWKVSRVDLTPDIFGVDLQILRSLPPRCGGSRRVPVFDSSCSLWPGYVRPTTHISRNDARRNVEQRWDLFLESSLAGVARRPGQQPDGSLLQALTVKIRIDNQPEASRPFKRSTAHRLAIFGPRLLFFHSVSFLFSFFFYFSA